MAIESTRERHHIKHRAPPADRAARRGLDPTANSEASSLDSTPPIRPVSNPFQQRNRSEGAGRSTAGQMLIWQKRFIGDTLPHCLENENTGVFVDQFLTLAGSGGTDRVWTRPARAASPPASWQTGGHTC